MNPVARIIAEYIRDKGGLYIGDFLRVALHHGEVKIRFEKSFYDHLMNYRAGDAMLFPHASQGVKLMWGVEKAIKKHFVEEFAAGLKQEKCKEIPGVGMVVWQPPSYTATLKMTEEFHRVVMGEDKKK